MSEDTAEQGESSTNDRYAHLRKYQFKPGQSGNPAGRAKRESFESIVQRLLDQTEPGMDATHREVIAGQFIEMMKCKNTAMIKEFADRVWPKLTKHEITGRDGEPVDFRQIIEKAKEEST